MNFLLLQIFATMDGVAAPEKWAGGMDVQYRLTSSRTYELNVNQQLQPKMAIQDVCAFIYGSEEPDQVVLIGSSLSKMHASLRETASASRKPLRWLDERGDRSEFGHDDHA